MKKHWRAILIIVAVLSFGIAFSYPILYRMAEQKNNDTMQELSAMRERVLQEEKEKQSHEPSAGLPAGGLLAGTQNEPAEGLDMQSGQPDEPAEGPDTQNRQPDEGQGTVSQSANRAEDQAEGSEDGASGSGAAADAQSQAAALDASDVGQSGNASAGSAADARNPAEVSDISGGGQSGNASAGSAADAQNPAASADISDGGQGSSDKADQPAGFRDEYREDGQNTDKAGANPSASDRFQTGINPAAGTREENESEKSADHSQEAGVLNGSGNPDGQTHSIEDYLLDYVPGLTWKQIKIPEYEGTAAPVLLSAHEKVEDWKYREAATPYPELEKVELEEDKILPELKAIYERNNDLVGWIKIDDTVVDYPVIQSEDSEFYLTHDFDREENVNGQIILDPKCDPYTPSYNLVISGHHMNNGSMFGGLPQYRDYSYWQTHKIVEFDNLMERKQYVIFAAFYSADYDEYEEGFRYNADIQYKIDAVQWLEEIRENQIFDTEIDAQFGDEFVTLTTCDRSRRQDGRFVLVCRRLREGEEIE